MKLLDQSLRDLIAADIVTGEEAARFAEDSHAMLAFAKSGGREPVQPTAN